MSQWNDALLNNMRQMGDPLADTATRAVFEGKTQEERNRAIHNVVMHPLNTLHDVPPELQTYFDTMESTTFTPEEEADFDKAIEIFDEHGFRIFLLLFFKSLPTGYLCPKPGHVLATTQLLVNQATRRVFETALYIMSVMDKDWYKGERKGLKKLEKLRFLHSSMRVQILDDREWDEEKLGIPINQEDQVLTLQLFSLAVIRGLHEMGIMLSREDRDAWFRAWRRIGRIIGIEQELEPKDIKDGWALQNKILSRQIQMPNQDGPALTNALLTVMNNLSNEKVSMDSLERITRYFLFHVKGMNLSKIAKSLGMKSKPTWFEWLVNNIVYWLVNWELWDILFHRKEGASFFVKFIRRMLAKALGMEHLHDPGNETEDVLDAMVKEMLHNLKIDDKNQHHGRAFEINERLTKKWKLEGWEYIDK